MLWPDRSENRSRYNCTVTRSIWNRSGYTAPVLSIGRIGYIPEPRSDSTSGHYCLYFTLVRNISISITTSSVKQFKTGSSGFNISPSQKWWLIALQRLLEVKSMRNAQSAWGWHDVLTSVGACSLSFSVLFPLIHSIIVSCFTYSFTYPFIYLAWRSVSFT